MNARYVNCTKPARQSDVPKSALQTRLITAAYSVTYTQQTAMSNANKLYLRGNWYGRYYWLCFFSPLNSRATGCYSPMMTITVQPII